MYVGNMWIWWNSSSLWGNVWQACHDNNSKPVVKMITVCVTDACNEAYKRHKRVILKMRQNIWENDLRVSTVKYIIVYILLCLHEDHFLVCFVSSSKYTLWFIWLYNGKHTYDSTRSTSGASDTFYESLSLPMSPTRKSACDLLNLLSPRQSCSGVWGSCSGVWGSSATSSVLTPMRIIHVPSMLASMTRRRSGDDLVVALVKHGYAPSRTTSNIRTWDCGRPGTELTTVICGMISWKWRRSCRGMLHDKMSKNLLNNVYVKSTRYKMCKRENVTISKT